MMPVVGLGLREIRGLGVENEGSPGCAKENSVFHVK
jgi:hypothetical protein